MKDNIWLIKGVTQHYAWGGTQYIPKLLGLEVADERYAEYWLGANDNGPSILQASDGEKLLNEYLRLKLTEVLGDEIAKKFGRLPFLFKVLDVREMLSIQVHPTKEEAGKGFEYENKKGIPLNAPNRNYKDDNHKPEIMVALSEFWLLHGFLPKNKLTSLLENTPEFKTLLPVFEEKGYFGLYKKVMEQSEEESDRMLQPLVKRILPLFEAEKLDKSSPDYWAAKSIKIFGNKTTLDKGIFSIYFFNVVKVNKGEAVFQAAGIPHAYLEGQNMELMANSDNVLRGGLTTKHVDVQELLKHVVFEETNPNIMLGELQSDGLERIYKSPAPDFELSQISISSSDRYQSKAKTAEILIVIDGEVKVFEGAVSLSLTKGQAAFLSAASNYEVTTPNAAVVYKATAPLR